MSSGPRGDERSDQVLLQAHVDGDSDAFGVLFARHRDRLWAVALRTMGNPEDAADGLQDGMIAAFRRAGSFRGDAAVTTWLHRVVVNACLDRLRAAKIRRLEAMPDDVEGAFFSRYIDLGVFGVSPFETLDSEGIGRLVKIAVEEGRATRPNLKVGVCGEHGGDPESVHFFHHAGLDYVSCSPFRVPVARLEAGRASLDAAGSDSR